MKLEMFSIVFYIYCYSLQNRELRLISYSMTRKISKLSLLFLLGIVLLIGMSSCAGHRNITEMTHYTLHTITHETWPPGGREASISSAGRFCPFGCDVTNGGAPSVLTGDIRRAVKMMQWRMWITLVSFVAAGREPRQADCSQHSSPVSRNQKATYQCRLMEIKCLKICYFAQTKVWTFDFINK